MDKPQLIWLLQMPSLDMHAWRTSLREACDERGWEFAVHERGCPTPKAHDGRPLLVVGWLDQIGDLEVTNWAVQLAPPLQVAQLLKTQGDLSEHDALYEASLRLATGWKLSELGALTYWCDEKAIELPGLGRVDGPSRDLLEINSAPSDHPLAMFDRGGVAGQKKTVWEQTVFLFPDSRPSEVTEGYRALVGRRRLLFHGPNIFLPPGNWRFSAELSIQPPGRTELLVEWGHGHEVVSVTSPIDIAGRYEFSFERQWDAVQPADFRVSLMIPALEGEFSFHGGVLTRQ